MTQIEPEAPLPVQLTLDDRPGPANRLARDRAAAMVETALAGFTQAKRPTRRHAALLRTLAIAAAALLALTGVAFAARFYFEFGTSRRATPATHAAAVGGKLAQSVANIPASEPAHDEPAESVTNETSEATEKAPRWAAAIDRTQDDLLQKANRLRAIGQFREAAQTYAQIYDRYPKALSAYVARVAAGSIALEHLANPTLARRLFEQALRDRPAAALDLEARQGLCVALRDLEDRPAEVHALQGLIRAHPDSPAARRAQVRLRETGDAAQ